MNPAQVQEIDDFRQLIEDTRSGVRRAGATLRPVLAAPIRPDDDTLDDDDDDMPPATLRTGKEIQHGPQAR